MAAVTVVGAGRMGLAIVANLVSADHTVQVVDIDEHRRADARAVGAARADALLRPLPTEQTLITVLPGNDELCAVMLDSVPPDGHAGLDHLQRGSTWIDMTSAAPHVSARAAAGAAQRGVRYLDAAIGGGPAQAAEGRLVLFAGGTEVDVDRVRPLLAPVADEVRHVGGHGAGHLTKLLINQMWFGQAAILAEVFLLGTHAGLSPDTLLDAVTGSPADSAFVRDYLPRVLAGDYVTGFELSRVVEELDSLEKAAGAAQTPWTVAARVADLHRGALAALGDRDEELSVIAWLEQLAGRSLTGPPE